MSTVRQRTISNMLSIWVLCVSLASFAIGQEPLPAPGTTDEPWTNAITTTSPLWTDSPEAPETNATSEQVDGAVQSMTAGSRARRAGETQKERRSGAMVAETDTQSVLGRTAAVWVEMESVLGRREPGQGQLRSVLQDLKEEKKRLLDEENKKGKGKKEEEEEEEEDDDDEEEEDDDDDEEDEEEEEKEEEEEEEEDEEEEEEEEEAETDAASNSTDTNSTDTKSGFTNLLPEDCQQMAPLISCRDISLTRLPIITDLAVTKLELPGNNISKIPPRGFSGLPNLEEIDLSRNKLEDSSLGRYLFKNLTKLRKLNLDSNGLTTLPLLPASLEELSINQNRFSQLQPKSFRGLFNLRSLELNQNELYDDGVSPLAFRTLKNLVYLRLDQNNFRTIPLGLPPSLQDLRMRENQLQEVDGLSLNKSVNLQVLDLSHNYLREHTISPQAWINLPKLEALDLSNNQFSLVPSHLPTVLRQLSLQHNHIDTVPAFVLSHLSPGLLSLRLSHNRIRNDGLKGPSFRGAYRTLTELLLDNNELEVVPRCMRVFRELQLLRLDHNHIKYVPRFSLCKRRGRKNSSLASVHLENNQIDLQKIPPAAFTCMDSSSNVILEPQGSSGTLAGAEGILS